LPADLQITKGGAVFFAVIALNERNRAPMSGDRRQVNIVFSKGWELGPVGPALRLERRKT